MQKHGCVVTSYRFDQTSLITDALESIWWWNLTVDQVVASSILVEGAESPGRHPADEGAVLKTAGVQTLRGSSPWSSALVKLVLFDCFLRFGAIVCVV